LITGHCGCVMPQIGCQTSSDGVTSSCACQELYGQEDGGVTNTCSIPLIPWTICCLSTLAGYCNCYANGHTCNATLESAVQSCTAAATGVAGTGCQVSNGYCSCDQVSSGDSLCPSALLPVCCQGPYQCRCDYGATCAASEQKVPSCSATALQPLKQCSSEEMLVASCH
jgi:hypothetical protein